MSVMGSRSAPYTRSRGMGLLAVFVLIAMVIGYFRVFIGLWTPVTTDFKIKAVLNDLAREPDTADLSPNALKTRLSRRLNFNSIYGISDEEIVYKRATQKNDATLGIVKAFEVVFVESKVTLVYKVNHSVTIEKSR